MVYRKKRNLNLFLFLFAAAACAGIYLLKRDLQSSDRTGKSAAPAEAAKPERAESISAKNTVDARTDLAQAVAEENAAHDAKLVAARDLAAAAPGFARDAQEVAEAQEQSVKFQDRLESETEAEGEDLY